MMRIYNSLILLLSLCFSNQLLAAYALPEYQKVILANGLTLYLMEQHEVPLIDINIVVKAGAIEDGQQAGLSYLTAQNLSLGTQALSKSQIDESMDFIGANIHNSANIEFATIGASFANNDQEQVMTLLRDMLIAPKFDREEFDKFKKRQLLQFEQNKESPKSVINTYFNRLIFGDSSYGAVVQGDSNSLNSISLSDIKKHHQRWYQPNNSALVIVGDFDATKMSKRVDALFGQWLNHQQVKATPITQPKTFDQSRLLLVNKADAIESTFYIGGLGIARNNKDYVGIDVINTILGGRFTSWLNDELRTNSGLTYGAKSRFTSYSQAGSFVISTFTKTESTVDAMNLALKTYAKLWETGIDEATLASAKAYVKGQFPPEFETSAQLSQLLGNMYGYNIDDDYINTFEQQVNSLTLEKTKQLITQYFPQNNLQFVVIGKAQEIKEQMEKFGQVKIVNIEDVGFDIQ